MNKKYDPHIGVRVPKEYVDYIDEFVKQGEYSGKSEFVRKAVETFLFLHGKIEDPGYIEFQNINNLIPMERLDELRKILDQSYFKVKYGYNDVNHFLTTVLNNKVDELMKEWNELIGLQQAREWVGDIGPLHYTILIYVREGEPTNELQDWVVVNLNDIKINVGRRLAIDKIKFIFGEYKNQIIEEAVKSLENDEYIKLVKRNYNLYDSQDLHPVDIQGFTLTEKGEAKYQELNKIFKNYIPSER